MAKTARAAMKAKAQRLGSSRPTEKVDSSTFTPPELLNADVKTGLRPISRRQFKKGGKVMGDCNAPRADRKPRKSGGKAEAAEYANAKINRNVKAANEERPGIKHVGALKTGGRAKKQAGGGNSMPLPVPRPSNLNAANEARELAKQAAQSNATTTPEYRRELEARQNPTPARKSGGRTKKAAGGPEVGAQEMMSQAQKTGSVPSDVISSVPTSSRFSKSMGMKKGGKAHEDVAQDKALIKKMVKSSARTGKEGGGGMGIIGGLIPMLLSKGKKSGGRTGKADGGEMMVGTGSGKRTDKPQNVYQPEYNEEAVNKAIASSRQKIGGREGSAIKALLKGRTGKAGGGRMPIKGHKYHTMSDAELRYIRKDAGEAAKNMRGMDDKAEGKYLDQINDADTVLGYRKRGGQKASTPIKGDDTFMNKGGRTGRKTGGGVFTGPSYPGKIPGVVAGGRTARASGGKAKGKGKTNINIVIAAGKTPGADAGLMPPGMPKPMGGIPIPLAPQGGPPQGGAPMPMPMPMPMPAPAGGPVGGPAGMPPMGRKSGGRISKIASSYKDMEAGSAGGEGRLQKTDIAKKGNGAPTFKKGGKVYRSYKDMDAGSASGLGRLEKTEIAARKS
jgi:hypothetical protein